MIVTLQSEHIRTIEQAVALVDTFTPKRLSPYVATFA